MHKRVDREKKVVKCACLWSFTERFNLQSLNKVSKFKWHYIFDNGILMFIVLVEKHKTDATRTSSGHARSLLFAQFGLFLSRVTWLYCVFWWRVTECPNLQRRFNWTMLPPWMPRPSQRAHSCERWVHESTTLFILKSDVFHWPEDRALDGRGLDPDRIVISHS